MGDVARASLPRSGQFNTAGHERKRGVRVTPPFDGGLWVPCRPRDHKTVIFGPSYTLAPGTLANPIKIAAVGDVDHQPVEAILSNGHSLRELEQRPDVFFALKVEVRNAINTAPKVAIHRNIEFLSAKHIGARNVTRHEELANPLPDFSSETLYHWDHCCIDCPSHTLKCVHAIDVLLHAAVAECAPDRNLGGRMGIADERGRDARAIVPVAARAPTGPVL